MAKRDIKALVMDVDGTLTDGKIYIGNSGEMFKAFCAKDGCGIKEILIPEGIKPVIITGRESKILENRCKEIGIEEIYQGVQNKLEKLDMITKLNYDYENFAYIGDDINDLLCMEKIKAAGGVIGCPADAVKKIKEISDYVCIHNGGDGAVREFIEWILL